MLLSKVSAQKKVRGSYDSTNMCSNFGGFRCSPPSANHEVTVRAREGISLIGGQEKSYSFNCKFKIQLTQDIEQCQKGEF